MESMPPGMRVRVYTYEFQAEVPCVRHGSLKMRLDLRSIKTVSRKQWILGFRVNLSLSIFMATCVVVQL
jgi:hypothetical protein